MRYFPVPLPFPVPFPLLVPLLLPALLLLPAARPVLAQAYTLTDLGMPAGYTSSSAKAINGKGQVTGEISHGTRFTHAFLYSGGRLKDLNRTVPAGAHWSLTEANGINDDGVIVGRGEHEGRGRAFLLTPKGR